MYSTIDEAWQTSNDLDKYKKKYKPVTSVTDATNEINNNNNKDTTEMNTTENKTTSDKVSTPSSSIFNTELRDLKGSLTKDDGMQCDRLFSHMEGCQQCRNRMVERFNNPGSLKLTESFLDFTKYTDLLSNKNNSNIISIILFGLLIIIILSMINNESK
jgi:hypothetical protein